MMSINSFSECVGMVVPKTLIDEQFYEKYSNFCIIRDMSLFLLTDEFVVKTMIDNDRGIPVYKSEWKNNISIPVQNDKEIRMVTGNIIFPPFFTTATKSNYTFVIINETPSVEKIQILKALEFNTILFKDLDDKSKTDYDIVHVAIKKNKENLQYVTDEIALDFIKTDGNLLKYVREHLKDNIGFVLEAVVITSDAFQYASDNVKRNINFLLKVLEIYPKLFNNISEDLKYNIEFVLKALDKTAQIIIYIPDSVKQNTEINIKMKEIILSELSNSNSIIFRDAPIEFKNDIEFVLKALDKSMRIIHYIPEIIQDTLPVKNKIIEILSECPFVYREISINLKRDVSIVLMVLNKYEGIIEYIPDTIQQEESVKLMISKIVIKNPHVFRNISRRLKKDTEYVDYLVSQNNKISQYARF